MTGPAARLAELQVALMLLTRLPAGRIGGVAPGIGQAAWAFPLAGLPVGAIAAAIFALAGLAGVAPGVAAVLALAAGLLATGALHEDGLADTADGFGGGRNPAHMLEIMRDSRIGSYGTLALIISLSLRGTAMAALADTAIVAAALIGLAVASRACLPAALAMMSPARNNGLGHDAAGVGPVRALIAAGLGFAFLLPLGLGPALITAAVLALTATTVGVIARRRIGGQTGDVLGAMQQCAEMAGWVALTAL